MSVVEQMWARASRWRRVPPAQPFYHDSDVVFISFPKCGRTWLHALVSGTFQEHFQLSDRSLDLIFGGTAPGMPRICFMHDGGPLLKRSSELERTKEKFRRKKIVLLVRDPRDALVSLHFHITRRVKEKKRVRAFSGPLSDYIRQPIGGLDTFIEYYKIWEDQRHVPAAFLLVRYEDLHSDASRELRRVMDFVGVPASPAALERAIVESSFEKMHQREARGEFSTGRLRPRDAADPDSYKTRRGRIGGFVDYFTPSDIEYLNHRIRAEFPPYYGYQV